MLPYSHSVSTREAGTQFRAGVIACLPTVTGYWSIGFAAGAMGTLSGFSLLHTALLAAFLYAGSAQFLFYSLWAAGADIVSVVVSVVLVNLRYLLMSSALSLGFKEHTFGQKIISGLLLTDETFGVAAQHSARHGTIPFYWMAGLNLTAWINWIIACLAGAWLASTIPASVMDGLSFSLVSMFIGLVLMTWFASQQKGLETLTIIVAIILTLCSADYLSISLLVVFAAAISATLATLVLRLTARQRKPDDV
ncbi:AzlC family ABC transporter permease [Citrobacter sp. JGM124]|uniref:AzlC family ABC transporter permease n=1 Tax=Citrobacter sp. JGM124 TaxID=2799789 RepID=UPI001BAA0A70|nr:AzlC family ABC transporter permease [Citrobacter sp. JGM124]MBS0849323.1 AzlC family ABC transporter permease [Citrobacter sp. JGM124]